MVIYQVMKKLTFLLFVLAFAFFSVSYEFWHDEAGPLENETNCPICLFKSGFFSTLFFVVCLIFVLFCLLFFLDNHQEHYLYNLPFVRLLNKSPPAISSF